MDDPDFDEMNRRAWFAMRHGFSRSVADDLIALLRSGADIAPEVREELAAALDGGTTSGVRLTVSGNLSGNHGKAAADAQRDALRVIAHIEAQLHEAKAAGVKLTETDAVRRAASALKIGEAKSKEAWQEIRPIYRECLAKIELGPMWAGIDQAGRESWAMSFAYGQQQQKRRARRKPHKGTRFT